MPNGALSREEALKLTDELFQSISQQSLARESSSFSPDVLWAADFLEEGVAEGIDAVNEALKVHLSAFPDLRVTLLEESVPAVFENGTMACEVAISGTNTGELPGIGTTGRSMEGTGMTFITFDDEGRVARIRTYWDWSSLMAQLGMRSFARPGPAPQ